jgi:hypothetical protein
VAGRAGTDAKDRVDRKVVAGKYLVVTVLLVLKVAERVVLGGEQYQVQVQP